MEAGRISNGDPEAGPVRRVVTDQLGFIAPFTTATSTMPPIQPSGRPETVNVRRVQFAALLVGLSLVTAPAVAAGSPGGPSTIGRANAVPGGTGSTLTARISRARVLAYWTPARMRAARSLEVAAGGGRVAQLGEAASSAAGSTSSPFLGIQELLGRGTSVFQAVTGSPWTEGGAIVRTIGKIFLSFGTSDFVCSGAIARDTRVDKSLVLTAAHCTYDQIGRRFATNWLFVPAWDMSPSASCAGTAYGCWTAEGLVLHRTFATAGGFTDAATARDYAFAVVGQGGKTGVDQLDATVGSMPLSFSPPPIGDRAAAFGYPAVSPYGGNDLIWCAGHTFNDPQNSANPTGIACNMTPGSSGGPWLARFSRTYGSGVLVSVTSYGYAGTSELFGPRFDRTTRAVLTAADAAGGNQLVR